MSRKRVTPVKPTTGNSELSCRSKNGHISRMVERAHLERTYVEVKDLQNGKTSRLRLSTVHEFQHERVLGAGFALVHIHNPQAKFVGFFLEHLQTGVSVSFMKVQKIAIGRIGAL